MGKVWGGLGPLFSLFFRCFFEKANFVKIVLPCRRNAYFQGSRLKKTTKNRHNIDKNSLQIRDRQIKCPKIAQKLDLRGSWAPFWKGFAWPWTSCGRSWALLTRFWSVWHRACIRYWSKMACKRPLGSILGSSWRDCGRNWEILDGFSAILGKISADGNVLLAPSYKSAASAARPFQYFFKNVW